MPRNRIKKKDYGYETFMTEKLKAIIIEENKILKMHPRLNLFSNLLENKYFIVSKDNVINKSSESLLSSIKRLAEELHQQ